MCASSVSTPRSYNARSRSPLPGAVFRIGQAVELGRSFADEVRKRTVAAQSRRTRNRPRDVGVSRSKPEASMAKATKQDQSRSNANKDHTESLPSKPQSAAVQTNGAIEMLMQDHRKVEDLFEKF